jgi:large subunit ribosomal protein L31
LKKTTHPAYNFVVIKDAASDFSMLTRSTQTSNESITWNDGKVYSLITVEVSSASHPFFTGHAKVMDTAGRIEKFNRKYDRPVATR